MREGDVEALVMGSFGRRRSHVSQSALRRGEWQDEHGFRSTLLPNPARFTSSRPRYLVWLAARN
jgi:hypothetical protein